MKQHGVEPARARAARVPRLRVRLAALAVVPRVGPAQRRVHGPVRVVHLIAYYAGSPATRALVDSIMVRAVYKTLFNGARSI